MHQQRIARLKRISVIISVWLGVALLVSIFTLFSVLSGRYYMAPLSIIAFEIVCILPWLMATPLLLWTAHTYRLDRRWTMKAVAVHLLVAGSVFGVHAVGQSLSVVWFFNESFTWSYVGFDFMRFLDMRIVLYAGSMAAIYAIDYYQLYQDNKRRQIQLARELNMIKYRALKSHMQPVFLLNTIGSIQKIMYSDPERAERILADLSDLMRLMLQQSQEEEITLKKDLEFLGLYVRILEARLNKSITYDTQIEEVCLDARIPSSSAVIPLLEEIILQKADQLDQLEKISYSGRTTGNHELQLAITVEKLSLTDQQLFECYKTTNIANILDHIEHLFDKRYPFHLESIGSRVILKLRFPLVIEESLKNWAKTENQIEADINQ